MIIPLPPFFSRQKQKQTIVSYYFPFPSRPVRSWRRPECAAVVCVLLVSSIVVRCVHVCVSVVCET